MGERQTQSQEDVAMLINNLEYFIGSDNVQKDRIPIDLFNETVIEYLDELSTSIIKKIKSKQLDNDLLYFANWTRRRNIEKISREYAELPNRFGCGLSVHIAPSNVATNTLFTYAFGLLAGNSMHVRVSEKTYRTLKPLTILMKDILVNYEIARERTNFFLCKRNDPKLVKLIEKAATLVVWGGDKTVEHFQALKGVEEKKTIYFRNRISHALISQAWLRRATQEEMIREAGKFAQDIALFGQRACSSPKQLFVELDSKSLLLDRLTYFFSHTSAKINEMKSLDIYSSFEHFQTSCELIARIPSADTLFYSSKLMVIHKLSKNSNANEIVNELSNGCLEMIAIKCLNDLSGFIPSNAQTLTAIGYSKDEFKAIELSIAETSVCRIVRPGNALNIEHKWDGHDIILELSEQVTNA